MTTAKFPNTAMSERTEINRALSKALAFAECGKFIEAQSWGEVLIRKLELAGVFKANSVHVDDEQTLWLSRAARGAWSIIGPDELPLTPEPFASRADAEAFIPQWCARYQRQGYYSAASGERIALSELPARLSIVEVV